MNENKKERNKFRYIWPWIEKNGRTIRFVSKMWLWRTWNAGNKSCNWIGTQFKSQCATNFRLCSFEIIKSRIMMTMMTRTVRVKRESESLEMTQLLSNSSFPCFCLLSRCPQFLPVKGQTVCISIDQVYSVAIGHATLDQTYCCSTAFSLSSSRFSFWLLQTLF